MSKCKICSCELLKSRNNSIQFISGNARMAYSWKSKYSITMLKSFEVEVCLTSLVVGLHHFNLISISLPAQSLQRMGNVVEGRETYAAPCPYHHQFDTTEHRPSRIGPLVQSRRWMGTGGGREEGKFQQLHIQVNTSFIPPDISLRE